MSVTDFHNHVIPGVDDGARDAAQARAAVEALLREGVRTVIATPHFSAALTHDALGFAQRLAALDAGWAELQQAARDCGARLERGAEIALDAAAVDLADPRIRLAGTAFALVEFAYMTVPPNSAALLASIRGRGWRPILAHPERYWTAEAAMDLARSWKAAGAYLQVNGASLLGRYGAEPRRAARRLLELGMADYVASDYHARGEPRIGAYRRALEELGGTEHAELLLDVNPHRILLDEPPLPVPPTTGRRIGMWQRIRRRLR